MKRVVLFSMDTSISQKFIICNNCGAINKKENTICIKCGAYIDLYTPSSDYENPNFEDMNYNIPGNYLTDAGKETPDTTDFIDEPEQDDDDEIFVPEPDEFGLNGVIPKRTVSSVNLQNSAFSPADNKITLKNPLVIVGLAVLIMVLSIVTIKDDKNSETVDVVINETRPVEDSVASTDNPFDKFYQAYCALNNGKEISLKKSKTYALVQEIKKKDAFYISLTDIDKYDKSESTVQIAVKDKDIAIINESEEYSSYLYIDDMKYTLYYPSTKAAQSMTLDQNSYAAMGLRNYIFTKLIYDISDDPDEDFYTVRSYTTEIDGKTYTYETIKDDKYFSSLHYYVYDNSGKLCMSGDEYGSLTIIDKFTDNVPPSVFNQPLGYNITDLDDENE